MIIEPIRCVELRQASWIKKNGWITTRLVAIFYFSTLYFCGWAQNYTVNTTADGRSAVGTVNLRGAIEAADAAGGTHIITLPAGTFNLTLGQITLGNKSQAIFINGAGSGNTVINMAGTGSNRDRTFFINPTGLVENVQTTVTGVKFTNGYLTSDNYGGGAILAGGPGNALTLTNCMFQNNSLSTSLSGSYGGGAVCFSFGGTLLIDQCTFTNNFDLRTTGSPGSGGAVYVNPYSGTANNGAYLYPNSNVTIINSTFSNNAVAPNGSGGALAFFVAPYSTANPPAPTVTVTVRGNTFLTNTAPGGTGRGGAIYANDGFRTGHLSYVNYNRFVGNKAGSGNGDALYIDQTNGIVDASNNWWGCNAGPAFCADDAYPTSTTPKAIVTPFLQLRTTTASASLCNNGAGNSTAVQAGFTVNSVGTTIPTGSLSAFTNVPITFAATLGSISSAQATTQANALATATYTTNGTAGTGTVSAQVDNVPTNDARAATTLTVNAAPSITTQPMNAVVCQGATASFVAAASSSGNLSFQWYKGNTALSNGATGTGSTVAITTTATSSTLTITNPGPADAVSDYNVQVSSSTGCGPVTSTKAGLVINTVPVIDANSQPVSATVCTSNPVAFTTAASGSGTLSFQWYRGSALLNNGPTGSGSAIAITSTATASTLTITNASPADNALDYTVRVSSGNACSAVSSAKASLTVLSMVATASTSTTKVVSGANTILTDGSCNLITTLSPSGAAPVSGAITAKVWIESSVPAYNQLPYVARHYELTPATNATTATATVVLYFLQAEFDAYNQAPSHGPDLPVDATDAAGNKANLRLIKKKGTSSDGSGLIQTYSADSEIINPASVVWDASGNRWVVTAEVAGFGGFFATTNVFPDFTPTLYARPSNARGTTTLTVVVDLVELNSFASNGPVTVKIPKDALVSLTFPTGATRIGNRPVQNGQWQFDGVSSDDYYLLTSTQTIAAGEQLSFGLEGVLTPGASSGVLTISAVLTGGGEIKITNNTDADRIEYFQQ